MKNSLDELTTLVLADGELTHALSRTEDIVHFAELLGNAAKARGIALASDDMRAALRPDPIGMSRWTAPLLQGSAWPSPQWLPIQVVTANGVPCVDWAHFGGRSLTEPFFEDSIRRALKLPFNRLFRYRMRIEDFLSGAADQQSLPPSGFIFHMSRCGSTLAAQMLAALPHNIVVSEAPPIDTIVQLSRIWPNLPVEQRAKMLAAMVAAFGRRRASTERHYFIKLDSWHTLALPLFRQAFPSTPWVFLYRDPVEVLVSQMRQRGAQMVPEIVPPGLYGLDGIESSDAASYCARVLSTICAAAADHAGRDDSLLIDYRELPEAVMTRMLPHFGVSVSDSERAGMRHAARFDAKDRHAEFSSDSETKQNEATGRIRSLAEQHVGEVHARLEALRGEQIIRHLAPSP